VLALVSALPPPSRPRAGARIPTCTVQASSGLRQTRARAVTVPRPTETPRRTEASLGPDCSLTAAAAAGGEQGDAVAARGPARRGEGG